jgi:hypothetical protein
MACQFFVVFQKPPKIETVIYYFLNVKVKYKEMEKLTHENERKEWLTMADFYSQTNKVDVAALKTWAFNNGFEYTRLAAKNIAVRKVKGGKGNQIKHCQDKAATEFNSINSVVEPVAQAPVQIKHSKLCKCAKCVASKQPVVDTNEANLVIATNLRMVKTLTVKVSEMQVIIDFQNKVLDDNEKMITKLKSDIALVKLEFEQYKMLKNEPLPNVEKAEESEGAYYCEGCDDLFEYDDSDNKGGICLMCNKCANCGCSCDSESNDESVVKEEEESESESEEEEEEEDD